MTDDFWERIEPLIPVRERPATKEYMRKAEARLPLWRPVVSRRNRRHEHDVTQLDRVLQAIMAKRKTPSQRHSKHLCADAGYRGKHALDIIESHGYIPHSLEEIAVTGNKLIQPLPDFNQPRI